MEERSGSIPKGQKWYLLNKLFGLRPSEIAELEGLEAADVDRVRDEMGDVLFVVANLARHLGVEPETALQATNAKFKRRFQEMEGLARAAGKRLADLSLSEQDELWNTAKQFGDTMGS